MHTFFKDFQYDSSISDENAVKIYQYDKKRVDEYYTKHRAQGKLHYAIMLNESVIGDIYLKNMDSVNRACELGIHMINDHYKGKGYGTQALLQIKQIAFKKLRFKTLYANTRQENMNCRRALVKAGYREMKTENGRCLYVCRSDS